MKIEFDPRDVQIGGWAYLAISFGIGSVVIAAAGGGILWLLPWVVYFFIKAVSYIDTR